MPTERTWQEWLQRLLYEPCNASSPPSMSILRSAAGHFDPAPTEEKFYAAAESLRWGEQHLRNARA